jgi:hypothetical protein
VNYQFQKKPSYLPRQSQALLSRAHSPEISLLASFLIFGNTLILAANRYPGVQVLLQASFEDTSFTDTKFGAISNINYIGKILKDLLISLALEDISAQAI